jgi:hypothetical protein
MEAGTTMRIGNTVLVREMISAVVYVENPPESDEPGLRVYLAGGQTIFLTGNEARRVWIWASAGAELL